MPLRRKAIRMKESMSQTKRQLKNSFSLNGKAGHIFIIPGNLRNLFTVKRRKA